MSDVESNISSPDWELWDDMDDDNIDVSQFQDNVESQQHENEGIKPCNYSCCKVIFFCYIADIEHPTHEAVDDNVICPPHLTL